MVPLVYYGWIIKILPLHIDYIVNGQMIKWKDLILSYHIPWSRAGGKRGGDNWQVKSSLNLKWGYLKPSDLCSAMCLTVILFFFSFCYFSLLYREVHVTTLWLIAELLKLWQGLRVILFSVEKCLFRIAAPIWWILTVFSENIHWHLYIYNLCHQRSFSVYFGYSHNSLQSQIYTVFNDTSEAYYWTQVYYS